MISVSGVSKSFDGVKALSSVDLNIEEGEVLGIFGPNGAGKSTLFDVITGLTHPDSGSICFNGKDITGIPAHKISRMGIYRGFQDVRVIEEVSVLENILLSFSDQCCENIFSLITSFFQCRKNRGDYLSRASEILKRFSLESKTQQKASELSYGQTKKLSLAMCQANSPDVFLFDEPVSGVDSHTKPILKRWVSRLVDGTRSAAIIEHDTDFLFDTADRVLRLVDGRVEISGRPKKVKRQYIDNKL